MADLYGDVLDEDSQSSFFNDTPSTKKRIRELISNENPDLKGKALEAEVERRLSLGYGEVETQPSNKYDAMADIIFGDKDLDKLNGLSIEGKNRVANMIDKAFTKDIRDTLHPKLAKRNKKGKENLNVLNKAVDMLEYSPLPLGMIVSGLRNEYSKESPGGTLINSNLFTTPGYYPITKLFLGDQSQVQVLTNAMAHLRQLGVGAGQAGPYEQALAVFDKNISVGGKGDIILNGELFEVKAEDGRIGPSEYPGRSRIQKIVHDAAESVIKIYKDNKIQHDFPGAKNYFTKKGITYEDIYNFRELYIKPLVEGNHGQNAAYEFISSITRELYNNNPVANPIITGFIDLSLDFRSVIHIVIRQLFAMYKDEKSKGSGAWDYLLGINAKGGFAVIQTEEDLIPQIGGSVNFAETYSIAVVATGTDATRDYMFSFTPTAL
jgi:hypothetical protein